MASQSFPLQDKLKQAMIEDPNGIQELNKHLIEALTAEDPGMVALGYDCLQEVLGLLTVDQRHIIIDGWNEYFDTSPEFKDLMEKKQASKRLLDIYEKDVKPLMMKPEPAKKPAENALQTYLQTPKET